MPDIRLMAFDLDGTLLDRNQKISPANMRALKAAHEKGIKLVIASGRGFLVTRRFAFQAGIPMIIATANGARIDETQMGPLLSERCLEPQIAGAVLREMKASGLFFVTYCKNANYEGNIASITQAERDYYRPGVYEEDGFRFEMVADERRLESEGIDHPYKFVCFSYPDDPKLDELKQKLLPLGVSVEPSWCNNIEVMSAEAGKGNALALLCEIYGFTRDQVMAFGDNFNDESMLRFAGWPVVMENGADELKKLARIIAPHHDEDGVARVIDEYVLK